MTKQGMHNLQPCYFGPFKVLEKVGPVAYRLDHPDTTFIHPIIYVSQIKLARGELGHIIPLPKEFTRSTRRVIHSVLARKMVYRGNKAGTKLLIHWEGQAEEEVTCEFIDDLRRRFSNFDLDDKAGF